MLGDTNDAVRAGAEQPVGTHTHARTALSASTIDNPPRLCACRSIVLCQRARRPATAAAPRRAVRGRPAAAQNLARATKQLTTEGCAASNLGAVDRYWPSGRVHPPARVVDPARREVRPAARRLRALRGRALRLRVGGRHAAERARLGRSQPRLELEVMKELFYNRCCAALHSYFQIYCPS